MNRHEAAVAFMLGSAGVWAFAACASESAGPKSTANQITMTFVATVDSVDDLTNLLAGAATVGNTVTGAYTYDLDAVNRGTLDQGEYLMRAAPYGIKLSVGGLVFQTDPSKVEFYMLLVNDVFGEDEYFINSFANLPLQGSVNVEYISWQLNDSTEAALDDVALTSTPPVLADWQSPWGMVIQGANAVRDTTFVIWAHVTSVSQTH